MADKNLKIAIEAVDNAKKTLDAVQKELSGVSGAMDKVKKASDSQTASIFKGLASWDLLKKSVRTATDFLRSSFSESLEGSRVMAQVKINVENAGFAYDSLSSKLKEVGNSAVKMGFDDETATESLSKFLLITKDMTQAQSLLNLSMDLARNKNIDLSTATKQIALVTQGNTKALKEYGIELGDTATTADVLIEAQSKLKGSTEAYANTTAGKLASMNEEWDNMKQAVGDGLTPAMADFAKVVQNNLPAIIEMFNKLSYGISIAVGWIAKLAGADMQNFASQTEANIKKQNEFADAMKLAEENGFKENKAMKVMTNEYFKAEQEVTRLTIAKKKLEDATKAGALKGTVGELETLGVKGVATAPLIFGSTQESKDTASKALALVNAELEKNQNILKMTKVAYDTTTKAIFETSSGLTNIENKSQGSGEATDDLSDSVNNLSKQFDDLGAVADQALFDISEKHKTSLDNFKKQLSDIRAEMESTKKEFDKQKTADQSTVAGAVIANEQRIADIQTELAGEVEKTKRRELEAELASRQQSEIDNASFIQSISDQVAEARRVAGLSELERAIEEYNQKRALAESEYSDTINKLKSEMKEIKKQRDAEKALYQEKVALINKLNSEASANLAKSLENNTLKTKAEISKQIEYYKNLAEAINASKTGNSGAITRIQTSIRKVQDAVISPNGDIISTDPNDYIIATKNPKNLGGGGGNVVINIGTMVGEKEFARAMGDQIIEELQLTRKM